MRDYEVTWGSVVKGHEAAMCFIRRELIQSFPWWKRTLLKLAIPAVTSGNDIAGNRTYEPGISPDENAIWVVHEAFSMALDPKPRLRTDVVVPWIMASSVFIDLITKRLKYTPIDGLFDCRFSEVGDLIGVLTVQARNSEFKLEDVMEVPVFFCW